MAIYTVLQFRFIFTNPTPRAAPTHMPSRHRMLCCISSRSYAYRMVLAATQGPQGGPLEHGDNLSAYLSRKRQPQRCASESTGTETASAILVTAQRATTCRSEGFIVFIGARRLPQGGIHRIHRRRLPQGGIHRIHRIHRRRLPQGGIHRIHRRRLPQRGARTLSLQLTHLSRGGTNLGLRWD